MALRNGDFKVTLKKLIIENGRTQKDIGEKLGWSQQLTSYIIKKNPIDENFVKLCEELGYDVQISYKRRDGYDEREESHY